MKSASEWGMQIAEKLIPDFMGPDADKRLPCVKAEEIIKNIQLDAWKQGMTDAADIALNADCKSLASHIDLERDKRNLFTYNCE